MASRQISEEKEEKEEEQQVDWIFSTEYENIKTLHKNQRWIENFIINHMDKDIRTASNNLNLNNDPRSQNRERHLAWFSVIYGGYAWSKYLRNQLSSRELPIMEKISKFFKNIHLREKDHTLELTEHDKIHSMIPFIPTQLNLMYFVSSSYNITDSVFLEEFKEKLLENHIINELLLNFVFNYYKNYVLSENKIEIIMTFSDEDFNNKNSKLTSQNFEQLKGKEDEEIKELIREKLFKLTRLTVGENNKGRINFVKDDNIFGRYIKLDVINVIKDTYRHNILTVRIIHRPHIINQEESFIYQLNRFRNAITDGGFYLGDDGLLLFQELITENRMKNKVIDIDGKRKEIFIKTQYSNIELDYLKKFIDLFNLHIAQNYKYSNKFLKEKKIEILRDILPNNVDKKINKFEEDLVEKLRSSINAVLVLIQKHIEKQGSKIFISGGDAFRRYLRSIEKSADIDAKIYYPHNTLLLHNIFYDIIRIVVKYIFMFNNNLFNFKNEIEELIKEINDMRNEDNVNELNNYKLSFVNQQQDTNHFRIRTKKSSYPEYKLLSIDYEVTINFLSNRNSKYKIQNYKHQVAVLDLVFEAQTEEYIKEITINKYNKYLLPVASREFLLNDLRTLLTVDIKRRAAKKKHFKDVERYNQLNSWTREYFPSKTYETLNHVKVEVLKYLDTPINSLFTTNQEMKKWFKEKKKELTLNNEELIHYYLNTYYTYCCIIFLGLTEKDKLKSPFNLNIFHQLLITNCEKCHYYHLNTFAQKENISLYGNNNIEDLYNIDNKLKPIIEGLSHNEYIKNQGYLESVQSVYKFVVQERKKAVIQNVPKISSSRSPHTDPVVKQELIPNRWNR